MGCNDRADLAHELRFEDKFSQQKVPTRLEKMGYQHESIGTDITPKCLLVCAMSENKNLNAGHPAE